jgi:acetyl esterase/lipase
MAKVKLRLFIAISLLGIPQLTHGERPDHVITLWPNNPPGQKMDVGPERDFTKDTDDLIAGRRIIKLGNVTSPEAHVFLPPVNVRTGASVVICPGGGFSILAWDLEGTEVAQWLNKLGIAGIVLKYRVPTRGQNPRWMAATQDTQRTVSLVRHHAKEWEIDTEKVAVLGFSAGGVAAVKTTLAKDRYYDAVDEADKASFRPNRSILIYAGGLPRGPEATGDDKNTKNDEDLITSETPPVFMVHAFDDFVPVEGTANMLLAMKKANVSCELHVYESGGHGYGLRKRADQPVTYWTEPCEAWLRRAKWVD